MTLFIVTIFATLLVACLLAWPLIVSRRPKRLYLFIFVFVMAFSPIALYEGGRTLLGYPIEDIDLLQSREFVLIHSYADDATRTIYALVIQAGDDEPRLFAIRDNYDENKQKFGKATQEAQKGLPQVGRPSPPRPGAPAGEFTFYSFTPPNSEHLKN